MPIPAQRDVEQSRKALAAWLAEKVGADVELGDFAGPGATGFSNETIIVDATYGGKVDRLVVRVAPTGYTLFPDAAFDAQHQILVTLATQTAVPVPAVRWFETDPTVLGAPFFVMAFVDGVIPEDNPPYTMGGWLKESSPEVQERVFWGAVDTIAEISALDPSTLDLPPLLTGLDAQLDYYERFLESVAQTEDLTVARRALAWLKGNKPEDDGTVFCWGDSRIGNVMFTPSGERLAVVDWEMAVLGSPSQDLAWAWFLDRHHSEGMNEPRLPGFPSKEAMIARFESRSGRSAKAFDYYELFAGFRFCVIMGRLAVIFKDWGLIPADHDMGQSNAPVVLTTRMLDEKGAA
ncbi:MAG: phosphotransferase family protein [Mycobacteriales bacterium]|nr:phosphotransferase family protein [Mycobacteriales bacterium]